MAEVVRLSLMRMWEQRSKATEAHVITTATAAARSIMEMTSQARLHWGDSAAIHELLREVDCVRQRQVMSMHLTAVDVA
jgi:hypothetical protein